jgi:EpsI family protein
MRLPNNRTVAIAVVVLLAQAGAYYTVSAKEVIPQITPWNEFPLQIGNWRALNDTAMDDAVMAELQPDDYLNRNYGSRSGQVLNLFIGYFSSRRDGRAPHSPEWCLPGAGWKSLSTRVVQIDVAGGSQIPANEYVVEKSGQRYVVVYWYHQGQKAIASEWGAQLYAIPDMVLHGRTDTSLVRIITPSAGEDVTDARETGFAFARESYPLIREHIR